jgi:hypothetical protein
MTEQMPQPSPQLCTARYSAEQIPGCVVLTASGFHQTSGYKVFFQQSLVTIFPPQYSLWHVFPGGIVLDVITPFTESVRFAAKGRVPEVVVWDATGRHVVRVDSASDFQVKHAIEFLEKDGPFP